MKYILSVAYILFFSFTALADRSQYLDLNKFLKPGADLHNDIGYLHMVPQYEENPDPNKAVAIEIFFGEYDGSEKSKARLRHIKEILDDDKRLDPNFKTEVIAVSNETSTLKGSRDLDNFLTQFKLQDKKVHYNQVPDFADYTSKIKKNKKFKRYPASLLDGRKFWTLIRFSSTMAGTFAGLYYMEGLSASMSASVALWPGLASGAITYYSNSYGSFLTSGKWATWLLESDNYFAKKVRASFKMNPETFTESLSRNKEFFREKYPSLYEKNPTLFEPMAIAETKMAQKKQAGKFTKILSRLKSAEEYFKWWVTEVAFTATAIKIPQAVAGIGGTSTIMGLTGDILMGSVMGMIAQGPGDIAIQVRKYQKIEELQDALKVGKIQVENPQALKEEIRKVLDKTGKFKSYTIHEGSHASLVKIENWSRSRATLLSFFAVTGVGLEIAGVPMARPLLIAVGAGGALYYSSVQGWIKPKKYTDKVMKFINALRDGELKFSMQFLKARYCSAKYMVRS